MKRRSIAFAGVFLIVAGSISLDWYAWMYGVTADIPTWNLLFPEAGGDLLSLVSLSSSVLVLGVVFILWAYKLRSQSKNKKIR